jgi:NitT/TauT family transport system substrate-binding protein
MTKRQIRDNTNRSIDWVQPHELTRRLWLRMGATAVGAMGVWPVLPVWAQSAATQLSAPVSAATKPIASQGLAAVSKPEKKNLVIATPNRAALLNVPLVVAEQLGFFAQMGVELEINEQPSMLKAQQAAVSGAADAVCGWVENTLAQQAKGQAFQCFVLMARAPQMALVVARERADSLTTLASLRGKKVGVLALGSPTHTVAHAVLRKAGLRSAEMGFVSVGSAASAAAALRSGQIDALVHMDPLITQLEQRGEIRVLADMRSPAATWQATGMELPSSCLYAKPEFLQRMPGLAQTASDALVMALRWLSQASLLDVMKLMPDSYLGDDRQVFIASFERVRLSLSTDGLMHERAARQLMEAMQAAEPSLHTEEPMDASKCYTNAFVLRSQQRVKP